MKNEEYIEPSEIEKEAVMRMALHAAMEKLNGLTFHEEHEGPEAVRKILEAAKAINDVGNKESKKFKESHPKEKCYGFDLEPFEILATAFWACGNEIDGRKIHPTCIAGAAILHFATAISALGAANIVTSLLSDGSSALAGEYDTGFCLANIED